MAFRFLTTAAGLALTAAMPAQALTAITTLYSTGVDNAGVGTSGNGVDLHWTLAGGTAYTGATNGQFPVPPWVAETALSRWVTPQPLAAHSEPKIDFTYSTTFSLAGFDPKSASFSGKFAADDTVTLVTLNGVALPISGGGYKSWTAFDSSTGQFLAGLNTLSFTVYNGGGGPTGLDVQLNGSADASVIPEAATWAMMVTGFAMAGTAFRRRTRAVAA